MKCQKEIKEQRFHWKLQQNNIFRLSFQNKFPHSS